MKTLEELINKALEKTDLSEEEKEEKFFRINATLYIVSDGDPRKIPEHIDEGLKLAKLIDTVLSLEKEMKESFQEMKKELEEKKK